MERKIEQSLLSWKNSARRKPLLLKGARQVGKTWSLLSFGKKYYPNVLYINFESNRELHQLFEKDLDPARIIRELEALSGKAVMKADTLMIWDEIQSCERALTSLKYFNEEAPGYHLASAGSLLGVAVNREKFSFPVGQVDMQTLYPLDFEEFLWATGHDKATGIIRDCFQDNSPCSLHQTFLDHYYRYLSTGGMPQVVKEWIETADYDLVVSVQNSINDAYIADMAKYATPAETVRIMAVYNSIPAQLAKENRKFQYSVIRTGARAVHFDTAIDWLEAAGILMKCIKVTSGASPLKAWEEQSSFKAYMNDSGLLSVKYGLPRLAFQGEASGFDNIKGALTENYVATSLQCNGFTPHYWESSGKAEVDFVVQFRNGETVPVEVKSSMNVRSKSLREFVSRYQPPYSIRVSTKNFGFGNQIRSVPLYAVSCIVP